MAIYTCIQKNVNKNGVALSYILSNETGQVGEFTRDAVLLLLNNRVNQFTNLKLTSDNKIIFTNNDNVKEKQVGNLIVHPSTVLAMLINNLRDEECSWGNKFCEDVNNNRDAINYYLSQIEAGITNESYKALTNNSKMIRVEGVYKDNNGKIVGFEIKNVGDCTINFLNCMYEKRSGYQKISSKLEKLPVGKTMPINLIDAVKLISAPGFGGMWSNALLKVRANVDYLFNTEDFASNCYLHLDVKEIKGRYKESILISMGENQNMGSTSVQKPRKSGIFGLFKR